LLPPALSDFLQQIFQPVQLYLIQSGKLHAEPAFGKAILVKPFEYPTKSPVDFLP
jgi:hypothetical protein